MNTNVDKESILGISKIELFILIALFAAIISAVYFASTKKSRYDLFNESANTFFASPNDETYKALRSAYYECWNDNNDEFLSMRLSCYSVAFNRINDGDFNAKLFFDSLIKNNRLDFAIEVGFFDERSLFYRSDVWKGYALNYQGNNFTVNRTKAITLIRTEKYRSAYDTLIKAFASTDNAEYKSEIASIVRGLLRGFGCTNDMVIWEAYSINYIAYGLFSGKESKEVPLSNDEVKALRSAFDKGGVPDLQESCSLKFYKF